MFKKFVVYLILFSQGINGITPLASAIDHDDHDVPLLSRSSSSTEKIEDPSRNTSTPSPDLHQLYDFMGRHANYHFVGKSNWSTTAKMAFGVTFVTLCTDAAVEFAGYILGHAFSKATGAPYYKTREDGSLYVVNIAGHVTDGLAAPLAACKALRMLSSFFRKIETSSLDPNTSVLRRAARALFHANPLQDAPAKLKIMRAIIRLSILAVIATPSLMAVLSYEKMDGTLSFDAVMLPILLPFFWLYKADPLFAAEESLLRKILCISRNDFPCSKKREQAPTSKAELCREILKSIDKIGLSSTELSALMEEVNSGEPNRSRAAIQQLLQKARLGQAIGSSNRKKGAHATMGIAAFLSIPALIIIGRLRGDEITQSLLKQSQHLSTQAIKGIIDTVIVLTVITGVTTQILAGPRLYQSLTNPGDYVHPAFIRVATVYGILASLWLATEPIWSGIAEGDMAGGLIQILIFTSFGLDFLGKFCVVCARSVQDMRIGMDMVLEGISLFFAYARDFLHKHLRRSETEPGHYVSNHHTQWKDNRNKHRFESMRTFFKTTVPYLPGATLTELGEVMGIGRAETDGYYTHLTDQ